MQAHSEYHHHHHRQLISVQIILHIHFHTIWSFVATLRSSNPMQEFLAMVSGYVQSTVSFFLWWFGVYESKTLEMSCYCDLKQWSVNQFRSSVRVLPVRRRLSYIVWMLVCWSQPLFFTRVTNRTYPSSCWFWSDVMDQVSDPIRMDSRVRNNYTAFITEVRSPYFIYLICNMSRQQRFGNYWTTYFWEMNQRGIYVLS